MTNNHAEVAEKLRALLHNIQLVEDAVLIGAEVEAVQAAIALLSAPRGVGVDAALHKAAADAVSEINRLRQAMFATYCAAVNGADKDRLIELIEKERDAYETGYCAAALTAALAGGGEGVHDKGPWHWKRNGPHVDLFSDDFEHDVALRISGDFANEATADAYAAWLTNTLNERLAGSATAGGDA